mmetsp:Transcript_25668/g.39321  ORF Transcript_25668/g.39321 Transcript_25668/m.39321 type:complete len:234 (+) Transcript_25668:38-739(+)
MPVTLFLVYIFSNEECEYNKRSGHTWSHFNSYRYFCSSLIRASFSDETAIGNETLVLLLVPTPAFTPPRTLDLTLNLSNPVPARTLFFEGKSFIPFAVTMSIDPTSEPIAAQRLLYPAKVNPITTALATKLNTTFSIIVRVTLRPNVTTFSNLSKFESRSVTSAVSMASAAPAPIATPTSAIANAGASLTPSPHIRTSPRLLLSKQDLELVPSASLLSPLSSAMNSLIRSNFS